MKPVTARSLLIACLLCLLGPALFSQTICNSSGNLMLYTNYDGGTLTINVDQNIPNLKIGICSYEGCAIVLTGAFVNNVTGVRYAGFNSSNNHCGAPIATSISGAPGTAATSTVFAPPVTLANPNGNGSIICGYSCSNSSSQGGCNTVDQVEAYFLNYFPGSVLYAHKVQYGCWAGTQSLTLGGNCCPPPAVYPGTIAASQATVCAGSVPGPLNSTAAATVITGTILYQWQSSTSPGSGFSNIAAATAATYTPPALSATTYYRRAASTSVNNVVYSNTVNIAVTAAPVITISGPASVCAGSSATLTASGGSNYIWSNGNVGATAIVSPTMSGVLTITCFPVAGSCSVTVTRSITVLPAPVITASAAVPAICAGESATLDATGGAGYSWMPGSAAGNNIVVSPGATESYTVTGTAQNGCSNTAVINVIVNPLPAIQLTASSATACYGSTLALTANGAASYTWLPGQQTTGSITFTAQTNTTYTLIGEYNGCTAMITQSIGVLPLPVISATASSTNLCRGEQVTFTASGGVSYTWPNSTVTGPVLTITPATNGIYVLAGTAANGCTATAALQVTVNSCTGLESVSKASNGPQIFPNPNSGEFTVKAAQAMELGIVNSAGQLVRSIKLSEQNGYKASVSGLPKGVYFVVAGSAGGARHTIIVSE